MKNLFRLVDPPEGQEEMVRAVLAGCDFPMGRIAPAVLEDRDQAVLVKWEDLGQQGKGIFVGRYYEILLSTSYPNWRDGVEFTFAHELGHLVDRACLDDDLRDQLLELTHRPPHVQIGHYDHDHPDASHEERWRGRDGYPTRPNEAFADLFVRAFCPEQWQGRHPRFVHWTDDLDTFRDIVIGGTVPEFPDVPEDSTHHDAIVWAVDNGLMGGYGDGTFRPGDPVTRGQIATILRNALDDAPGA